MVQKVLLHPDQVRQIPKSFSWIDHQLMRAGYVEQCSAIDLALYLILVTAGDQQGLSYYSDRRLIQLLQCDPFVFEKSRHRLMAIGLIAYRTPLYQVLALPSNIKHREIGEDRQAFEQIKQALNKKLSPCYKRP